MRQVPAFTSYLVIGDGRVARHVRHYLALLHLPFHSWKRADGPRALENLASQVSHVLLLVSDPAIDLIYSQNPWLKEKTCVHFSGAHVSAGIPSAHPLMTFADTLYDLSTYEKVPFVLEQNRGEFHDLLPGLKNPSHAIPQEKKTLYHALCVLSGNFTILLWEKTFKEFQNELGLPKDVLLPYMQKVTSNLALSGQEESVLTGPLARKDLATIDQHLDALAGDPFASVYRAFVEAHLQSKPEVLK